MTLPADLTEWAARHGVAPAALADLAALLGAGARPDASAGGSETRVQSEVRLRAARVGVMLWRNNVGVLRDKRDVPVRFGLANDSKQLNERLKSGDLIGWRSVHITPAHVGQTIARFESYEVKESGWRYSGDPHEVAQARWAALVTAAGGVGRFITQAEELK